MRAGELGRRDHALHRHAGIGERDVLADRAVEQHVFLQHDADLAPQPGEVDHREIDAVDQHAPALRHVEPLHQLGERALARARGADDADDLAGLDVEAHVVQDLGPVDAVAESDVLERDCPADRRQRRRGPGLRPAPAGVLRMSPSRVHRKAGLMEVLPDLGEPQHRRADAAGQHVERDELADASCRRR